MLTGGGGVGVIAHIIVDRIAAGGKVLVFGCGGSSSTADHFASELVSHWSGVRLPCISLNTPATLTAIVNDYGPDEMFRIQVQALVRPGDVAIGITTSGKSPSVLFGLDEAYRLGAVTVIAAGPIGYGTLIDYEVLSDGSTIAEVQRDHLDWTHRVTDRICELWLERGGGYVSMMGVR